jgi:hypothetical protein
MLECVHSPGQFKPDYKIGICCFSAKHTVLRSKKKDGFQWLDDGDDVGFVLDQHD